MPKDRLFTAERFKYVADEMRELAPEFQSAVAMDTADVMHGAEAG